MNLKGCSKIALWSVVFAGATGSVVGAHEAWLLTPSEVEALSRAPMPDLFTNPWVLSGSAVLAGIVAIVALQLEERVPMRVQPYVARATGMATALAVGLGPLAVRIGLALMLGLGAVGGLPRVGVEVWSQPVLFVPDMHLALVPGWDWLAPAAFGVAVLLLLGLLTRLAAFAVFVLSILGIVAFGAPFLSYAPHFIAPALVLLAFGPGWLASDRCIGLMPPMTLSDCQRRVVWRVAMALVGGTFVYLGVAFKLFQPTLLIAILEHARFPTFGLPMDVVALAMTGVEIVAGLVLAMGRLVRPVALFLLGAFTTFAVLLGETPLFHANLYGMALVLLLAGAMPPRRSAVIAPSSARLVRGV